MQEVRDESCYVVSDLCKGLCFLTWTSLQLDPWPHFRDSPHLFSLSDLMEVHKGKLLLQLNAVHGIFFSHIQRECEVCGQISRHASFLFTSISLSLWFLPTPLSAPFPLLRFALVAARSAWSVTLATHSFHSRKRSCLVLSVPHSSTGK